MCYCSYQIIIVLKGLTQFWYRVYSSVWYIIGKLIPQSHLGLWPPETTCDHLRPKNSWWSSVVFWRLPTIMCMMVSADPQWSLVVLWTSLRPTGHREVFVASNTSLWPVDCREVFSTLLLVSECCTVVFSSRRNVSLVFSRCWSLMVSDECTTSIANQLPTSRWLPPMLIFFQK